MSGYLSRLPDDVLLDVGVLFVGGAAIGVTMGPSRGGLKFNPGIEIRNVPYDGQMAPTVGLDRKAKVNATIAGTFLLFGDEDVQNFEPGVYRGTVPGMSQMSVAQAAALTTAQAAAASIFGGPVVAGAMFTTNQYITDLTLRYRRGGGGYVDINFPYAVCQQYDLTGNDQSEVEIAAVFAARLLHTGIDGAIPYTITPSDPT